MTEQQEFDLIIRACVPLHFWDSIGGQLECRYGFAHYSNGFWLHKGSSGIAFGPFKTLDRATKELRKVIAGRTDGVLSNKEMYIHE